MYRNLDPDQIVTTNLTLYNRIAERFPDSSLSRVCAELLAVSREAAATSRWLASPHTWLRIGVGLCVLIILAVVIGAILTVDVKIAFSSVSEFLQALEAAISDVVFVGIAIFFLLTWEVRMKRARALKAIHVLRSLAHIIDMHQLTKDPERVMGAGTDTRSSPVRRMNSFELVRYLDYCSEMLSIISKVAAVYVEDFNDLVTLAAVNEVENLTTGLSRKIWQKIVILDRMVAPSASS